MRRLNDLCIVLAVLLASLVTHLAVAGGGCQHCGCDCACQKVCHLVCEEKKVVVTCWGCKCEDFCVPGPSKPGCKQCETVCEFCGEDDSKEICVRPKKFGWREWCPGCASVYTKKKLMRRTITKKVPSYKWVIEDLCEKCEKKVANVQVPPGVEVPPAPILRAKYERPADAKTTK